MMINQNEAYEKLQQVRIESMKKWTADDYAFYTAFFTERGDEMKLHPDGQPAFPLDAWNRFILLMMETEKS
jgi:hypothetical protein